MVVKASLVCLIMCITSTFALANLSSDSTSVFRKTNDNQLKILTWNIYMLPHCSLVHGNCRRARLIAQQLSSSDFDIIVFEEAFDTRARGILRRNLHNLFPYMYGPANRSFLSLRTNSGIWIVSKFPLEKLEEIEYTHRYGIDAMARKGAVMFAGNWNGQEFQLIGTHLQADGPDEIRRAQCDEISSRLLKRHYKENVPQIVCGDFNIETDDHENYAHMLHTLHVENGVIEGQVQTSFDEIDNNLAKCVHGKKRMIDYVLVSNSKIFQSIKRRISVLRVAKRNRTIDLSDHYGVEAIFEFVGSNPINSGIPMVMHR